MLLSKGSNPPEYLVERVAMRGDHKILEYMIQKKPELVFWHLESLFKIGFDSTKGDW